MPATPYPTSIQCWPGGKQLYHTGDPHGDTLRIHTDYTDEMGEPATDEQRRTIKVQLMAATHVERDILCCDTSLVSELLGASRDGGGALADAFQWENVENLRPDPSDWSLAECKEWLDDEGHDSPDPNPWAMGREELIESIQWDEEDEYDIASKEVAADRELLGRLIEEIDEGDVDGIDAWRGAVRDNATDAEVMQWFRVTSWLCGELRSIGEVVLDNDHGQWWGRQCCGQAIIMDGTFQRIAEKHAE